MPISLKNDGQDTLGDLLNGNGPQANDPGRFQRAENERRAQELNGPEYAELKFPAFPKNDTDLQGWQDWTVQLAALQPELDPHEELLLAKFQEVSSETPNISKNERAKQAVLRTRVALGLPLHGEKFPPRTHLVQNAADERNPQELNAEIARLNSEQAGTKKMRDNPQAMYRGTPSQYLAYAPKEKRGR